MRQRIVIGLMATGLVVAAAMAASSSRDLEHKRPGREQLQLERNRAQARRVYEEGLSRGIFEVPYTADFVGHGGVDFTHEQGLAEARGWRAAFPDLRVEVDLMVAESDLVSVRWTARGTNTGAGNGLPATGKRVQVSGLTMFRFVGGAIAEEWTAGNSLGLLKQLGLYPASPMSSSSTAGATQ